jgi:hypothetical protein
MSMESIGDRCASDNAFEVTQTEDRVWLVRGVPALPEQFEEGQEIDNLTNLGVSKYHKGNQSESKTCLMRV